MATIDNVRRIIREDFEPEYHQLIDKLAYVLNTHMEQVTDQINGKLDFTNLNQELLTVRLTVDSAGLPIGNTKIRSTVLNAKGLIVVKATNKTNGTVFPTATPFITFVSTGLIIDIKDITGLQTDNEYELSIVVIG